MKCAALEKVLTGIEDREMYENQDNDVLSCMPDREWCDRSEIGLKKSSSCRGDQHFLEEKEIQFYLSKGHRMSGMTYVYF